MKTAEQSIKADLDELIRVALTNPGDLQEFIRLNYPNEYTHHTRLKTYKFTFAATIAGSQRVIAANKEDAADQAEEAMRIAGYCNWQILSLDEVKRDNVE